MRVFNSYSRGYNYKGIEFQTIWEQALQKGINMGFRLRCGFAEHYADYPPAPDLDKRPFLMGIGREEIISVEGSIAGYTFVYTPPRFYFSPGDQELLTQALEGKVTRNSPLHSAALSPASSLDGSASMLESRTSTRIFCPRRRDKRAAWQSGEYCCAICRFIPRSNAPFLPRRGNNVLSPSLGSCHIPRSSPPPPGSAGGFKIETMRQRGSLNTR
jgi:hypothetical protein